jgi:hypothetical protein
MLAWRPWTVAKLHDLTSPLSVSRALNTLLERAYWVPTIQADTHYSRLQDDTDGSTAAEHDLTVFIDFQGDVWMNRHGDLRFRTLAGGGSSLRVRNALMVLAEAIRRDNEERPQRAHDVAPSQPAQQYEARRWCKGDGEWTDWQPVPPDKLAERQADPTFEVRPLGVDASVVPSTKGGE